MGLILREYLNVSEGSVAFLIWSTAMFDELRFDESVVYIFERKTSFEYTSTCLTLCCHQISGLDLMGY